MNAASLLIGAAFSLWWVDPYGDVPYLPDNPPAGGIVTNSLGCAAARGEFETISFSVKPERDMEKVDFVPSELTGPDGYVIPASAADFALVKVWYRADGRWRTSWSGNTGKPELINNLVIHDDALVRVVETNDVAKRTILLRVDYPEGPAYIDMRRHGGAGSPFNHSMHPVVDPKKFVPFDLRKDRFQQYWFTWKIPVDARPGLYKGKLGVKENSSHLGDIPVEVEVYPFTLPYARTHYDTTQPFISAWMGTPSVASELRGSKQMAVAERKVRGIYRSLADHNCHCPSGPGTFSSNSTDDLNVRSLIMMRQEGMACRLLINGPAFDWEYCWAEGGDRSPAGFVKATNRYDRLVQTQGEVYDQYLGHRNCYFSSADECGTWFNRTSYPFWAILHKHGFNAWTDYGDDRDISWSVGMNDVPASARHTSSWNWHKGGAKAVTYAGPFTGPADPDIWRRTKGLRYYYADFDGHHEYCFSPGENPWNDFAFRGSYSQFQMVYPAYDGLISTIAWEGVREGLDDIRYLSLLRMRCEAALDSVNPDVQALGRKHLVWMDSQDPELIIDLFAFRREVARRAIELIGAVGAQPPEAPLIPASELPPLSYEDIDPSDADHAKLAEDYTKKDRYDLAIPMWEMVRTNESQPPAMRFEAATKEAGLLSTILRRDDAVKVIDATISMPDLKNAQRVKLLLQRARIMMTSRIFEEEFTLPQLGDAAEVIGDALRRPGASEGERYGAIQKIVDAFLAGQHPTQAIAFVEARFEDVPMRNNEKCQLYQSLATAYIQLANWDKAAKMYRLARLCGSIRDRNVLKTEGWVAEQREDWETAVICYSDESCMYGREEKALKNNCVRRLSRVMGKLAAQNRSMDLIGIDGATFLDLDE